MKKIKIVIPDDLTPKQEIEEIAQKLTQKMLVSHGRQQDHKRIGNQVDVKDLKTEITIERKGESPVEYIKCNVCGCDYQSDTAKVIWTNYGGTARPIKTCSDICIDNMVSMLGEGRLNRKKSKLKPVRFY